MGVIERLLSRLPDAPTEDGTKYDGILSYAKEWHAAAIGTAAGVLSAALWLTNSPVSALLTMGAITMVALDVERRARKYGIKVPEIRSKTARVQIRREPWYALGFMLITFAGLVAGVPVVT